MPSPDPCMEETLKAIPQKARAGIGEVHTQADLDAFKAKFVGPRGALTEASKGIRDLPDDRKPAIGKLVNQVKQELEAVFAGKRQELEEAALAERIGPPVDPSLPSPDLPRGSLHPIARIRDELVSILRRVGFTVADGPEVETEWFCFDALNTAPDHPARDLQDTLYTGEKTHFANVPRRQDERWLLRTHTSTVQIRAMLAQEPPLRIISPGRVFRRDTVDATHSSCFHQIEALYVDKHVTVKDLKALLDYMMKSLLGSDAKTRFRPHFFPYTEPSFEMDCSSAHLDKVGREWTEMGGCGMVDPAVFEAVGYDPEVWSGYAFGFGLERLAMILYGIDDIRHFYTNDVRFLRQFA
ncbi:MAG: phenylalanine--tRNA ligase subunit alpha [Opitutales bacterium]